MSGMLSKYNDIKSFMLNTIWPLADNHQYKLMESDLSFPFTFLTFTMLSIADIYSLKN